MDNVEPGLVEAAAQLDEILYNGADLYTRSIRTSEAPLIKAALGFSLQPLGTQKVLCFADPATLLNTTAECVDFPVLVEKSIVDSVKAFYTHTFLEACNTEARADQQHSLSSKTTWDNLDNAPHVTRTALSHLSPAFVALSWTCAPQLDCYILCRRRWLHDGFLGTNAKVDFAEKLRHFLKELVLLDFLLSVAPKLQSLWDYRLWIVDNLHRNDARATQTTLHAEDSLLGDRLQRQDDVAFFMAAHNHPMNYNAWQYRRRAFAVRIAAALLLQPASHNVFSCAQYDSARVTHFIKEHNGDSSATSYLLFLLHEQDAQDKKVHFESIPRDNNQCAGTQLATSEKQTPMSKTTGPQSSSTASAPTLWRDFMWLTQGEIRQHSDKGHECMWHLRLGLMRWALETADRASVHASWRVEDELEWVDSYAEGYADLANEPLLTPASGLPSAWTESCGSFAWTSYNATRYGIQLIALLKR